MKYLFVFLLSAFFLLSCEQKKAFILSEEEMIDVLVDIHLADGVLSTASFPYDVVELRPENYYKNVLNNHNITRERFDSALSQYTENRDLYIAMYDKVIEELRTKESLAQGAEEESVKEGVEHKFFTYNFKTDYESKIGLRKLIQKGLVKNKHKSGKHSYKVNGDIYVEAYKHVEENPIQEIEYKMSFDILFDELPESQPTVLFALRKDGKFISHQYLKIDKFVTVKSIWQKVNLKVNLSLDAPESSVEISTYIFNKKKTSFYLDDYSLEIKQIK